MEKPNKEVLRSWILCPLVKRYGDCDGAFSPACVIKPLKFIISTGTMRSIKIVHLQLCIDGVPFGVVNILGTKFRAPYDVQKRSEFL